MSEADFPPADPASFPPELQEALRRMSQRGPVVDMATGQRVAEDGLLVTDEQLAAAVQLVACPECARAVALGWWGSIARHPGPSDKLSCMLCLDGEATLTATEWFALVQQLVRARLADGQRRHWREDALKGLGAVMITDLPDA